MTVQLVFTLDSSWGGGGWWGTISVEMGLLVGGLDCRVGH